jgi:beta-mannosidase
MEKVSLNGRWQLHKTNETETIPATVPGCVHTDLLAAGKIPDPYYRDNELEVQWIGETDWTYRRTFAVTADFLTHERLLLHCAGLDTLATVAVNGHMLGKTDNQFREWEFDVKEVLRPGENEIVVDFAAPLPYGRARLEERFLPSWSTDSHKLPGGNWLRKSQCNYGWDWGPKLTTSGIWRNIELIAYNTARLTDVYILQDHSQPGQVTLTINATIEPVHNSQVTIHNSQLLISISLGDELIAISHQPLATCHLQLANPQLWWPNGMGEQPLYTVTVQLVDGDGEPEAASARTLDTITKRIGLRTLELDRHPDEWGESFQFVVNGVPFFAKGANWIPADTFPTRVTPAHYAQLLGDAAAANMNMLRAWGGGIYEPDIFFDLCDELGLCVWQDFMFGCATYPTFDEAWMETVRHEAEEQIRRLRHHASLALWCGNNELEQGLVGDKWTNYCMSWEDYGRLYDQMLPEIVARLDPQTDYWPSSPHTPVGNRTYFNDPKSGDAHIWDVWHGKQPFEFYRTCQHRFNSEFGFQSFPEPRLVAKFTEPEDRNITSFVMEHHQRSGIGNQTIIHYMLDWFRFPSSFENTLWLSQIVQAMAMKYAVEHWRRTMPRGMGTLYWQLNDCWPVASWSSLDSDGRWKALHYLARHFYAPLLVSGVENLESGTVEFHLTNDQRQERGGFLYVELTTADGALIDDFTVRVDNIPAGQNVPVGEWDLRKELAQHGARNLLLWLWWQEGEEVYATNLVYFVRPKHLELLDPQLELSVEDLGNGRANVTVTTRKPALFVWLELVSADGRFSDNFFHLPEGESITAQIEAKGEPVIWQNDLRVHSLYDTWEHGDHIRLENGTDK